MGALGEAAANTERNKRKVGGSLSVSLSVSLNITSTQLFLAGRRSLSTLSFYREGKALHMQHTKHTGNTPGNMHHRGALGAMCRGGMVGMAGMPLFAHAGREKLTPPPLSAPLKLIKFCGSKTRISLI